MDSNYREFQCKDSSSNWKWEKVREQESEGAVESWMGWAKGIKDSYRGTYIIKALDMAGWGDRRHALDYIMIRGRLDEGDILEMQVENRGWGVKIPMGHKLISICLKESRTQWW